MVKMGVEQQEAIMIPTTAQPSIQAIATQTAIGTVREPEFRLVADLIRMIILGHEQRAAA